MDIQINNNYFIIKMTIIQRLVENILLGMSILTLLTYPYYYLDNNININYPMIYSNMNKIILNEYIMPYKASDKCIVSNFTPKTYQIEL